MWVLTKPALLCGITLALLLGLNSAPGEQNPHGGKTGTATVASKPKEPAKSSSAVGPAQPVITVHNLCDQSAGRGTGDLALCSKVITREEFEGLVDALNTDGQTTLPPTARRNFARNYAEFLAVEAAARNGGLLDTPRFREVIEWARLRAITDLYRRELQEKYRNPPQNEIDTHYKQHFADFETVKLSRILIPRENSSAADKKEFDQRARQAADTARERAAQGEDPARIQRDAYTALGLAAPPLADLGTRRRADLVAEEGAHIFSLKPNDVSQVQIEAKSYVIYKVISKDALPLEQVKTDIAREIYQQKFKQAIKSVIDAAPAEFNEQYFEQGTATAPPAKPAQMPPPAH